MDNQSADARYYASGEISAIRRRGQPTRHKKGRGQASAATKKIPSHFNFTSLDQIQELRRVLVAGLQQGRVPRFTVVRTLVAQFKEILAQLVSDGLLSNQSARSFRMQLVDAENPPPPALPFPQIEQTAQHVGDRIRQAAKEIADETVPMIRKLATDTVAQQVSHDRARAAMEVEQERRMIESVCTEGQKVSPGANTLSEKRAPVPDTTGLPELSKAALAAQVAAEDQRFVEAVDRALGQVGLASTAAPGQLTRKAAQDATATVSGHKPDKPVERVTLEKAESRELKTPEPDTIRTEPAKRKTAKKSVAKAGAGEPDKKSTS